MLKLIGIIIFLITLPLGVFMLRKEYNLHKNGIITEGVVVDIKSSWSRNTTGNRDYSYTPVIQFSTPAGLEKHESSLSFNFSKYNKGDRVKVQYNPNKPSEYRILGEWPFLLLGIVFIVVSVGFFSSLWRI